MKYYIGIDGGGTKTVYALFDENRRLLSEVKTAGANHENLEGSYDAAAEILLMGMRQLLGSVYMGFSDIEAVLIGLAGMDHPYQISIMKKKLRERGMTTDLHIYNDGYIVTKAGAPGGVGIGYNCGTGTCCNSIGIDGTMIQLGGFSDFSGDKGNGHWIAREVWRSIYDDLCVKIRPTSMTKAFFEKFGIEEKSEFFLNSILKFENDESESFIRGLIDIFFAALDAGDDAARAVCDDMSERGADFICAHLGFQDFGEEPVTVVLSGSLHCKLPSQTYVEILKEKVSLRTDKKVVFKVLDKEPVYGCINWLLDGKL